LRASLASATSLLALLLVEGHEAKAAPIVTSTAAINFGDVLVNNGASATQIGLWTISGQSLHDHFSISNAVAPFSGAGSNATINTTTTIETVSYSFSPVARGATYNTVVGFDATNSGTAASLTLTGTGVAPVEAISASNYVLVTPGGGAINLTISNVGDGNLSSAGTVSNLRGTVGSSASVFVGSGGTISLGDTSQTVTATSATFSYTYTPTISGQSATQTVVTTLLDGSSNGLNGASSVTTTLSGTGVAPVASISSASNAGYILVGTTKSVTVTVANTGNANLAGSGTAFNANGTIAAISSVNGFTGTATNLSLASNATGTTSSTATQSLTYTYAPTVTGSSSALVVASLSNASSNLRNQATSLTSTLTGTGVAPVAAIAASASAGYVLVTSSATTSFSIGNTGNANLAGTGTAYNLNGSIGSLSSSGFTGAAASIGLASNATGSTSSTSSTNSPTYTYTPTVVGSSSALVVETLSNGSPNGQNLASNQTTTLTGTGVAPVAAIAASASAGYVLVGSSATTSFSIGNTGNANLAGTGGLYNLNGSIGSLSSNGFTGAAQTIALASNATGSTSSTQTTTSSTYTYTPTGMGGSSALVVETLSNGSPNGQNLASNQTTTLTGTGVAPVQSVANSTVYGRLGSGATASGTITVANTGNANLAGTGTAYNLNGSIAAFSSGSFSGLAQSVSLASNATGSTSSTATSTLGYTYTPGSTRAASSLSVSIAFSDGNNAGTNASQTASSVLTGSAVGPTYASTLLAGAVVNTPTNGTVGGTISPNKTISFGSVGYEQATTVYVELGNITTDLNGGNAALTNLTIDKYSISGGNASDFTVSSLSGARVITKGGMLLVPITVVSNVNYGALSSSLTIFTDESVGLGGTGDTFSYALYAMSVPEPTSLAVLGAGLAGLASFRRRKRAAR
jgi:hypothetical protein